MNSQGLTKALDLGCGARFHKCAFQVNPFSYLIRHKKNTTYKTDAEYNNAIISACKSEGIEVIGVTDHHSIKDSSALIEAANNEGIVVFPGFEISTKEGTHFLCLFEPGSSSDLIQAKINDSGIHSEKEILENAKYDTEEFLHECGRWGAICIAAHITVSKGILRTLIGQAAIKAWKNPALLAASIPCAPEDVEQDVRDIVNNIDPQYRRAHPVALLNASDVSDPKDLSRDDRSCFIKMSEVSIEGLRQAFLDPSSRVRLFWDPAPEPHSEFVAISWEGGFLDGLAIHFNENLNVLVGGRGTGKSTIIESIRYVLGLAALGEEAKKMHEGIIHNVLKSGTKISLLIRSFKPDLSLYIVERTIPNPPVVKDQQGNVIKMSPKDILARVEIFGQKEIAEITKNPLKLTQLLERFLDPDPSLLKRKETALHGLRASQSRMIGGREEIKDIEEKMASLPALEEKLRRYEAAGVERKLRDRSELVSEEQVLKTAAERLDAFSSAAAKLKNLLPIDRNFLSEESLKPLGARDTLKRLAPVLQTLEADILRASMEVDSAIAKAETEIKNIQEEWSKRQDAVSFEFQKALRELQKSKIDGQEFIQLREQVETLKPLALRLARLRGDEQDLIDGRIQLLTEWQDVRRLEFQRLQSAARKVSNLLARLLWVQVLFSSDKQPLFELLKDRLGGRLIESIDAITEMQDFSPTAFAEACRKGKDELVAKFKLPPSQAERLAKTPIEVLMHIEELDLPCTSIIKFNVASEDQNPVWKTLDELSTGQKATAVLLLLMLETDAPLVVDQPEDDLDNRFITEGIVPKMKEEKCRRQFIFATHNANIPVLGDAELIVSLSAVGEPSGEGHAELPPEHMGSIDKKSVRDLVEEILEGGKEAFEMRRRKYGF